MSLEVPTQWQSIIKPLKVPNNPPHYCVLVIFSFALLVFCTVLKARKHVSLSCYFLDFSLPVKLTCPENYNHAHLP